MRPGIWILAAGLLLAAGCGDDGSPSGLDGGADAASCEPPSATCGSRCTNLDTDARNCGACAVECAAGSFCSMGACTRTCSPPLSACGGACVDVATDHDHCGACDSPCATDEVCRGGACGCPDGFNDCAGVCVDINQDRSNCGLCGRGCDSSQVCNMGSCTCASGAREVECNDGLDDDCDGQVDCDDDDCVDATRPCMGVCGMGVEACQGGGVWGTCAGGSGGAEICGDGIDQDCDGVDLRMPDAFEPNDDCDSCVLLMAAGSDDPTDPNVFLNASFDSVVDDVDCFKLVANDGGGLAREFIRVDLTEIPAGHDYDIYLYRGIDDCRSRTVLASSTNAGNADDNIAWGERFARNDSGTYYVEVRRFLGHSCTEQYRLAVNGLR